MIFKGSGNEIKNSKFLTVKLVKSQLFTADVDIKGWLNYNPFAPGDFAEKLVLKLVEWFSGHRRAIKS